jgi:hypothetical protein
LNAIGNRGFKFEPTTLRPPFVSAVDQAHLYDGSTLKRLVRVYDSNDEMGVTGRRILSAVCEIDLDEEFSTITIQDQTTADLLRDHAKAHISDDMYAPWVVMFLTFRKVGEFCVEEPDAFGPQVAPLVEFLSDDDAELILARLKTPLA